MASPFNIISGSSFPTVPTPDAHPRPDWLRDRTINILFQVGSKREADLPDVPLWSELGESDEQRQVLDILSGDVTVGRPILTAPEVAAASRNTPERKRPTICLRSSARR